MHFSYTGSSSSFIKSPVDRRCDGQSTSDHGANASKETREGPGPRLSVDDLHRRDIIGKENAGYPPSNRDQYTCQIAISRTS